MQGKGKDKKITFPYFYKREGDWVEGIGLTADCCINVDILIEFFAETDPYSKNVDLWFTYSAENGLRSDVEAKMCA